MIDNQLIINIDNELANGDPANALAILNTLTDVDSYEYQFLKGEILYKMQKWGDALNQFNYIIESYPEDVKAISYLSLINNILGFYHKDLYNP